MGSWVSLCWLQGIKSNQWKVQAELSWEVHVDTQPSGNGLSVLADSDCGIMIVESGNAVGVRFPIQKK